jgi:FeS assembly SUF system regulator
MIKLGKLTDYAVVLLRRMAVEPAAVHTAPRLSADTGLPDPTVAKVLKTLARGGLLRSQRGAAGGYGLARGPETITVAAIITAMEGPIALTECVSTSLSSCTVESLCPMRGGWEKVNLALRTALDSVTLADMMQPMPALEPRAAAADASPALLAGD